MGSKSAVEHSKHRQCSPRSVLWILCNHHLHGFFFFRSQSPQPLAKKHKKSNQPPSGLRSGWDSAIKQKFIAPANKSNTEDDDSLVQFKGMVGDDEDDKVEWSVVVMDKGLKQALSDMCVLLWSMETTTE